MPSDQSVPAEKSAKPSEKSLSIGRERTLPSGKPAPAEMSWCAESLELLPSTYWNRDHHDNSQSHWQTMDNLIHRFFRAENPQVRNGFLQEIQRQYYDYSDSSALQAYQNLRAFDATVRLQSATTAIQNSNSAAGLREQQFQALCDLARMAQSLGPAAQGQTNLAEQGLQNFLQERVSGEERSHRQQSIDLARGLAEGVPRSMDQMLRALADSGRTSGREFRMLLDGISSLPPEQQADHLVDAQIVSMATFLRGLRPEGNLTPDQLRDGFTQIQNLAATATTPSGDMARSIVQTLRLKPGLNDHSLFFENYSFRWEIFVMSLSFIKLAPL